MYIDICIHAYITYAYMHTHMYICTWTYMCSFIHCYIYIHIHTLYVEILCTYYNHTFIHIESCTFKYGYIHRHTYIHYICIYICTFVHGHKHTYIRYTYIHACMHTLDIYIHITNKHPYTHICISTKKKKIPWILDDSEITEPPLLESDIDFLLKEQNRTNI